jgi:hypothetical protein
MAVDAGTIESYANTVIREDLQEAYSMISPEEVPFQTAIGRRDIEAVLFEWPRVNLAAVNPANRQPEGESDLAADDGTLGLRLQNYTQISTKVVKVSSTSEAVDAAAENIQKVSQQITLKLKELKRDKETMYLDNVAAVAGSSGTARVSAGFPAFIRTNGTRGAGATAPTLSGTDEGFPDGAHLVGTVSAFTEDQYNDTIEQCWVSGADTTMTLVNANNKRVISETFTGSSTRYKDSIDKRIVAAVDIYTSDFGEMQVVPTRFMRTNDPDVLDTSFNVFLIDPDFARIAVLDPTKQKDLAETGLSNNRLIWCEDGLQVDNEAAMGVIADTSGAAA